MEVNQIVIDNPIVLEFIREYPKFNAESVLLHYIDIFRSVSGSVDKDSIGQAITCMQQQVTNQLLSMQSLLQSQTLTLKETTQTEVEQLKNHIRLTTESAVKESLLNPDHWRHSHEKTEQVVGKVLNAHRNPILEAKVDTVNERLAVVDKCISTLKQDLRHDLAGISEVKSDVGTIVRTLGNGGKGRVAEEITLHELERTFPKHEVRRICSSHQKGKMDIELLCQGLPTIRFELKYYQNPIPTEEVRKFERDILESNNHGIMISIHTKIIGKPHYHIDVLSNKCLAVYLSHTDFAMNDIVTAVQDIYNLDPTLKNTQVGMTINDDTLERIRDIIDNSRKTISEVERNLRDNIDRLKRMSLEQVKVLLRLTTVGSDNNSENFTDKVRCHCGKVFSRRGYPQHLKRCSSTSSTSSLDLDDVTL